VFAFNSYIDKRGKLLQRKEEGLRSREEHLDNTLCTKGMRSEDTLVDPSVTEAFPGKKRVTS
jgi:hypothetical protein